MSGHGLGNDKGMQAARTGNKRMKRSRWLFSFLLYRSKGHALMSEEPDINSNLLMDICEREHSMIL